METYKHEWTPKWGGLIDIPDNIREQLAMQYVASQFDESGVSRLVLVPGIAECVARQDEKYGWSIWQRVLNPGDIMEVPKIFVVEGPTLLDQEWEDGGGVVLPDFQLITWQEGEFEPLSDKEREFLLRELIQLPYNRELKRLLEKVLEAPERG